MAPRAPKSKYEINRELVLSTAHIPKHDAEVFDAIKKSEKLQVSHWWVEPQLFGYRVLVNDDTLAEVRGTGHSLALYTLMQLAYSRGCKWLVLDPDGIVHDELPQFDW